MYDSKRYAMIPAAEAAFVSAVMRGDYFGELKTLDKLSYLYDNKPLPDYVQVEAY